MTVAAGSAPSPKKPPRPGAVRERVLILVLTLVLMLLYFSVQRLADDGTLPRALGIAVMVLYMVSFGGLLIAYRYTTARSSTRT